MSEGALVFDHGFTERRRRLLEEADWESERKHRSLRTFFQVLRMGFARCFEVNIQTSVDARK